MYLPITPPLPPQRGCQAFRTALASDWGTGWPKAALTWNILWTGMENLVAAAFKSGPLAFLSWEAHGLILTGSPIS